MKCPSCEETINRVRVTSKCWRWATLKGNNIDEYSSAVEEISKEVLNVYCPKCGKDIYGFIEDK